MFPRLPLVKIIHAVLAVILVAEPILLAVPPSVVRAAQKTPEDSRPASIPDVTPPTSGHATATVPLLSESDNPSGLALATPEVKGAFNSAPIMFVEMPDRISKTKSGATEHLKSFKVMGSGTSLFLGPEAIWATILEPAEPLSPDRRMQPGAPLDEPSKPRAGVNLRMRFEGANPNPQIEGFDPLDTKVNFLMGNDQSKWRTDVPVWSGVRYVDLYPGIDLEMSQAGGKVAWKLVVKDASGEEALDQVRLAVDGAQKVTFNGPGKSALNVKTQVGDFSMPLLDVEDDEGHKLSASTPSAFQPVSWLQTPGRFSQAMIGRSPAIEGRTVTHPFALVPPGAPGLDIVSHPDIFYSTFLGGSSDDSFYGCVNDDAAVSIAVDDEGAAYVTGYTLSNDFPTVPGDSDTTHSGDIDVFVAKLAPDGGSLQYSTYLGHYSSDDRACGIAVDNDGAAYVTGSTSSSNFPTTLNAFDTTFGGGSEGFVVKLDPDGDDLSYGTFLGGSSGDSGTAIAIGNDGTAYVVGYTWSTDLIPPGVPGFDHTISGASDVFIAKLNDIGTLLDYATYLGGTVFELGFDIAIDNGGAAYVVGSTSSNDLIPSGVPGFDQTYDGDDAFLAKLNATGTLFDYATYLGGSGWDTGWGIAVNGTAAYITGVTASADFFPSGVTGFDQTFNGGDWDAYVAKLDLADNSMAYATYLGGTRRDWGNSIAVDAGGAAYVTGATGSADLIPSDVPGFDQNLSNTDAFVAKLGHDDGSLLYATYLGGNSSEWGYDIVLDGSGKVFTAGTTDSDSFPVTDDVYDTSYNGGSDVFVTALKLPPEVFFPSQHSGVHEADYQFDNPIAQAQSRAGAAISTYSAKVTLYEPDLAVPTEDGNLVFARSYSSFNTQVAPGVLSPGWTHQYETHLILPSTGTSPVTMITSGASGLEFTDTEGDGTYTPPPGTMGTLIKTTPPGGDIYTYTSSTRGVGHIYDSTGRLIRIEDGSGGVITLDYDLDDGTLSRVRNADNSRYLEFEYEDYPSGSTHYRLKKITDQTYMQTGRFIELGYTGYGPGPTDFNLTSVRDVNGHYWYYTYVLPGSSPTGNQPLIDPDTAPSYIRHYLHIRHQASAGSLVDWSTQPAISQFYYDDGHVFSLEGQSYIQAVQEKNGLDQNVVSLVFNPAYVEITHGEGTAAWVEQHSYVTGNGTLTQRSVATSTTHIDYSPTMNFRLGSVTDPNGHATYFTWDTSGLCLSRINLPNDDQSSNDLSSPCDSAGHMVDITNPDSTRTVLVYNTPDWYNPVDPANNPYDNPGLSPHLLLRRYDGFQDGIYQTSDPDHDLLTVYEYTTSADAPQPPGLLKKITAPGGTKTCYTYDKFGQVTEQRQNCEPMSGTEMFTTTYTYASDNTGRLVKVTAQPGNLLATTTLYLYDEDSDDDLPDEIITNYDDSPLPLAPGDYYRDGVHNFSTRIIRDLQGREVARVENYWDSNGDQTLSQAEISSGLPGKNHVTRTYYDAAGRVQYVVANFVGDLSSSDLPTVNTNVPDRNLITAYFYDRADRLAATVGNYAEGDLDGEGGAAPEWMDFNGDDPDDANLEISATYTQYNQITQFFYNNLSRVSKRVDAAWPGKGDYFQSGQNTYNLVTAFEYDPAGNITKQIANYTEGNADGFPVSISLELTTATTIRVDPTQPEMNVITCTTYDELNRPEVVTQACVPQRPDYDRPTAAGLYDEKVLYNVSTRYIYKDGRQIAVIRNYNKDRGTVTNDVIELDLSPQYNFITRTYYDGLGRARYMVDNFAGDVLSPAPTLFPPGTAPSDRNLATRFFYDDKGRQIVTAANYAPDGDTYVLSAAFNHVTRTYYDELGQVTDTVANYTGSASDTGNVNSWLDADLAHIPTFDPDNPDWNVRTTYQYDALGRQTHATQVRDATNYRATQTDYDDLGRVDKTTFTSSDALVTALVTDYVYEALGTEVRVIDPESRVSKTIQDALGNTIQSIIDPGGDNQIITNAKYDAAGRAIETSDATDVKTTTSFDALSRPTNITVDSDEENLQTNIAYDLLGNQSQVIRAGDPDNVVTTHIYNNVGWLLYTFENGAGASSCGVATSDVNVCTSYEYDDAGNLVRTTLGNGSQTAYEFDPLGRMTKEIVDPDRPVDDYTGLKITTRYEYDAAGNMVKMIRAPGSGATERLIAYEYDALGHVKTINYPGSTPDVLYAYDRFGNRKTMSDGPGLWDYGFNELDLMTDVTGPGGTNHITYTYDKVGNRETLGSTTLSLSQMYVYNSAGLLDTISNPFGTGVVDYGYDSAGRLTNIALPNGFATRYVYDTAGRLDKMYNGPLADPTTNPISSFDYTVNPLGQRTDNIESLAGIPAGQASQTSLSSGYAVHPGAGIKPFGPTDTGSGFAYAQGDADGSAISPEAASPLNPDSGYASQNGGSNPMAWQPFAPFLQAADTETPEPGETPESTATPQPTDTPTDTPAATATPDESATPTDTPTPTATDTPPSPDTETPTPTASPTGTATDTDTPTPTATATETETPTPSPTSTPTPDSYDALFDQLHLERDPAFAARSENQRMVGQQTTYRAAFDDAGIHFVGLGDDGEPVSSDLAIHLAGLRRGDEILPFEPPVDDTDDGEGIQPDTTVTPLPTGAATPELTPASPATRGPGGPAEEPILSLTEEPTLTLTPEPTPDTKITPTVEPTRLPEPEGWVSSDNLLLRRQGNGIFEAFGLYGDHGQVAYLLQSEPLPAQAKQDIRLTISLAAGLDVQAERTPDGFLLLDQRGSGVLIGMPTAVDAAGRQTALDMVGDETALTIVIPADWLAGATYPIAIDPVVTVWSHDGASQDNAFMAYDATAERAMIVFHDLNGTNHDVIARLIDATNGTILAETPMADAGDETAPVVTYNPAGPTGPEYLVAFTRSDHIVTRRLSASTGAALGSETTSSFSLGGSSLTDAAIDPNGGRTLVVWTSGASGSENISGALIEEDGSFVSATAIGIATSANREQQPSVTFDSSLTTAGEFIASWKLTTAAPTYGVRIVRVTTGGTVGTFQNIKAPDANNLTNRKVVYSSDADDDSDDEGQELVVWTVQSTDNLVAAQVNNTGDALSVMGSAFLVFAGVSGERINDKTDVYPDLSPTRQGWVVVWRRQHNDLSPATVMLKIATVREAAPQQVSTPVNVTPVYQQNQVMVDNPTLIVRGDGTAVTVHQQTPQTGVDAGKTSLVLTLNAGSLGVEPPQDYHWRYAYDGLGRVTRACSNGWNEADDTCGGSDFHYGYDGAGNLKRFDRYALATTRVETVLNTYNGANQIATTCIDANKNGSCGAGETITIYVYDVYGNLTSDGMNTYTYNAANQLTSVINAQGATCYTYTGDGDRYSKLVGANCSNGVATLYTLDPASSLTMTLAETTNGVTTKYWQGMDTLAQNDGTNTRLFAYDGLGSLRQMTDGATLTFNQTFDPYGNPYAKAGSATTTLGYTGEATDANGFVYLRARYYNPSMGRFMQFDPSRAEANLYGYAIGNPIGHTDSSGLCADPDAIFYDGVPEREGGVPCMYRKPVTGEVYMDKWAAGDYSPCLMCHASNAYYPVTGTSKLYSDELAAYDYTFRENYAKATAGSAVAAAVGACIGFSPCLGIAWGLYKFIDQVDDIATVVSAAFGDPNAQHGVMAVSALTIGTTDVPVNYLAAHPDEAAEIFSPRWEYTGPLHTAHRTAPDVVDLFPTQSRSLREAYELARREAGIPEGAYPAARVEFYYDEFGPRIRQIASREGLPFNDIRERFLNSTGGVRKGYQAWSDQTGRIRIGTGDPGAVGTIHIFDTDAGLRGVVLHPATFSGEYSPHLHAIYRQDPITAMEWALTFAVGGKYTEILVNGDGHIYFDIQ